jgi:hypothetical protein
MVEDQDLVVEVDSLEFGGETKTRQRSYGAHVTFLVADWLCKAVRS